MGSLILPDSGLVYLDAQILIYTVERVTPYFDLLLPLWHASKERRISVVTSELSITEVLTGPMKTGDQQLLNAFERLLAGTELLLAPMDQQVLRNAARLRAETSLRTPDAIHAATAALLGCRILITNDLALRTLSSPDVQILRDFVSA